MEQGAERVRRLLADELGECCEGDVQERVGELQALDASVDRENVSRDSARCAVLGNETRMQLLRYLHVADQALCVCELQHLVEVSDSAVSHALSDLTDVGLAVREKRGKWRYYEPTAEAKALLTTLNTTREPAAVNGGGV